MKPDQLALFGPQPVHAGRRTVFGWCCALCRASLAVAAALDRFDGCHQCPGAVEPAPWWAVLPDTAGLEEAAAELEETAA